MGETKERSGDLESVWRKIGDEHEEKDQDEGQGYEVGLPLCPTLRACFGVYNVEILRVEDAFHRSGHDDPGQVADPGRNNALVGILGEYGFKRAIGDIIAVPVGVGYLEEPEFGNLKKTGRNDDVIHILPRFQILEDAGPVTPI